MAARALTKWFVRFLARRCKNKSNNQANTASCIFFTKGVRFITWTNDAARSQSEQPYFIVQMQSKWIDGPLHANLTRWSRCEINVDWIWFKCGQALTFKGYRAKLNHFQERERVKTQVVNGDRKWVKAMQNAHSYLRYFKRQKVFRTPISSYPSYTQPPLKPCTHFPLK